jgi:hypothetical protein
MKTPTFGSPLIIIGAGEWSVEEKMLGVDWDQLKNGN